MTAYMVPTPAPTLLQVDDDDDYTWNFWTGGGHIGSIIGLSFFFCFWNIITAVHGAGRVPAGWIRGKCIFPYSCICPHWLVGFILPYYIGGFVMFIVCIIPYCIATAILNDDSLEESKNDDVIHVQYGNGCIRPLTSIALFFKEICYKMYRIMNSCCNCYFRPTTTVIANHSIDAAGLEVATGTNDVVITVTGSLVTPTIPVTISRLHSDGDDEDDDIALKIPNILLQGVVVSPSSTDDTTQVVIGEEISAANGSDNENDDWLFA